MTSEQSVEISNQKTVTAIEPNLDLIELHGRRFYLVGTAHVSRASADLVESVIERYKPDTVAVELCEPRLHSLTDPERWKNTDLYQVIRSGRAYVLMAQLVLASFQKRIASRLGVNPGEEMMRAIAAAAGANATLSVIDREVKITLKRAWATAGFWSMLKVISSLIFSLFVEEELTEQQIEELKGGDAMIAIMNEFSGVLPGVKQVLIDERDSYMAYKIMHAPGQTVVAVVGAGHVPGITQLFGQHVDIAALEVIPERGNGIKILTWGLPAAIILMIVTGIWKSGFAVGTQMVGAWVLWTGSLAALGAIASLAHPLTVICGFLAAPFTALHPLIAAGWVCGLVEAAIRKPQVRDLETIAEDIVTVKGFYRNRVSKVILIMALTNIGCAIGSLIGAGKIAALLGQ